jgi:transcriptional regulator GlxA family with amidase domain
MIWPDGCSLQIEANPAPEITAPGLLRGLANARLAPAIRQMHGQIARSWTVAQLAKTAVLSRSAFFERFTHTVGLPPMEYLLAWCMAVAKDLLRRHEFGLDEVAERVAYSSASTCRVQPARGPASESLRAPALVRLRKSTDTFR